jgi:hypothetical protein
MKYVSLLILLAACSGSGSGSSNPGPGTEPSDDGAGTTTRTLDEPKDVLARLGAGRNAEDPDAGSGVDDTPDGGGSAADAGSGGATSAGTGGSGGSGDPQAGSGGSGGSGGGEPEAGTGGGGWMPTHEMFLGDWSVNTEIADWSQCDTVDPSAVIYECTPSPSCPWQTMIDDETTQSNGAWYISGRTFDHWEGEVWVGIGGFTQPTEDIKAWYYPEVRFWLSDANTMYGIERPSADIAAQYPSSRRCRVYRLTRL